MTDSDVKVIQIAGSITVDELIRDWILILLRLSWTN